MGLAGILAKPLELLFLYSYLQSPGLPIKWAEAETWTVNFLQMGRVFGVEEAQWATAATSSLRPLRTETESMMKNSTKRQWRSS